MKINIVVRKYSYPECPQTSTLLLLPDLCGFNIVFDPILKNPRMLCTSWVNPL